MVKIIEGFRSDSICLRLSELIAAQTPGPLTIMEVCGGHTAALYRYGIQSFLPPAIRMVSGPGCPVCVSDVRFVDHVIALARLEDVIIATYGDLMRVPGSSSSLEREKAAGADIRTVWSALDATALAKEFPRRRVVFAAIGFETTIPGTAIAVLEAKRLGLDNLFVLSSHKIMPPAMSALIDSGAQIDAYLCPGHVSVVTGSSIYEPIAARYHKPCVISGFEPVDILLSILMIVRQAAEGRSGVEIQYTRAVKPEGNSRAQALIAEVFTPRDDHWRGLGIISQSGMALCDGLRQFDAERELTIEIEEPQATEGCICALILRGGKQPRDCPLYGNMCTPSTPAGACMVSSEGACASAFRYGAL